MYELPENPRTLDDAIIKFKAYCNGTGGFDELDFKEYIINERKNSDRRTLETIAALLNGDENQVEVVKNYVHNKLEMYRVKELEDATR